MSKDKYGRTWDFPPYELCDVCGQPDSCGDCNHQPLADEEVLEIGGQLASPSHSEKFIALHPAILAFAERMQKKLDKNHNKPCPIMNPKGKGRSWQHCDASWLHIRALEEVEELWLAMDVGGAEAVLDEAADVGNFLMMMCDVIQKGVSDGNAETS